jgi:hypothetical protein
MDSLDCYNTVPISPLIHSQVWKCDALWKCDASEMGASHRVKPLYRLLHSQV